MLMKKISKPKLTRPFKKKAEPKHERITNETVAEHREKILAGGRKFKYPVQYAQHRLVINTIIISLLALVLLVGITWWQLYAAQNTGAFFYRLTQLVPVPVATVDGQSVPYRDYLLQYRSSIHWLEGKTRSGRLFNLNSEDGQRESEHFKRRSLDKAIENAYAQKIADKKGITVTEGDIDDFIAKALQASSSQHKPSEEAYKAVLSESLGVSADEYRSIVKEALLKQKVSFAVDKPAKEKINAAHLALVAQVPFETVVANYSDDDFAKSTKGDVGFVPRSNQDQGLVQAALRLKPGETSQPIKGLDGYYIIKLTEIKDDQVRYARIRIKLSVFDKQLLDLKKQDKVQEYIKVKGN
jgi:hypothetical protein